jgi:hypothetical protein
MTRLSPSEFNTQLGWHNNGTAHYYKHPFFRSIVYSDGVKWFAENGGTHGAYWLLDQLLPLCKAHLSPEQPFLSIHVKVANDRCTIDVTDGNDNSIELVPIEYTDLQEGEYIFFASFGSPQSVLLLASEY